MKNKQPGHHAQQHGIALKKQYGQHFLRDQTVIDHMLEAVTLAPQSSIFEIGCGDGFLTRSIQKKEFERYWIFEIDADWVAHVSATYPDKRMTIFEDNILDIDFKRFEPYKPWVLLANLPYQITFPLLYKFQQHREIFAEGVIMVQEEVAQKIVKKSGRDYGFVSLFFQYYFTWKLLDKVPPVAFVPPPKVDSRLLYFKPRVFTEQDKIPDEKQFWEFIKHCFKQPRRTLKNNLMQTYYNVANVPETTLALRAQQMSWEDLLNVWNLLRSA